jgi:hypothetical protein
MDFRLGRQMLDIVKQGGREANRKRPVPFRLATLVIHRFLTRLIRHADRYANEFCIIAASVL